MYERLRISLPYWARLWSFFGGEVAKYFHSHPAIHCGKSEPDEDRTSLFVNQTHSSDLFASLWNIFLINANIVYPKSSGFVSVTQVTERSLEGFRNRDGAAINQYSD